MSVSIQLSIDELEKQAIDCCEEKVRAELAGALFVLSLKVNALANYLSDKPYECPKGRATGLVEMVADDLISDSGWINAVALRHCNETQDQHPGQYVSHYSVSDEIRTRIRSIVQAWRQEL